MSTSEPLILPWNKTWPTISQSAFVAPTASVIGDVYVGDSASIWFNVVLRGDVNSIRIGCRTNIQDGTIVHVSAVMHPTVIGDRVLIGHAAVIHACTLMNDCFVGMGAIVMDGAVVEEKAMVAAGALVPPGKKVKSGQLWAGRPARYVRDLTSAELREFSKQTRRYVQLGKSYNELTNHNG